MFLRNPIFCLSNQLLLNQCCAPPLVQILGLYIRTKAKWLCTLCNEIPCIKTLFCIITARSNYSWLMWIYMTWPTLKSTRKLLADANPKWHVTWPTILTFTVSQWLVCLIWVQKYFHIFRLKSAKYHSYHQFWQF